MMICVMEPYCPEEDVLHYACEEIWFEIRRLMVRYSWLEAHAERTSRLDDELISVSHRLVRLRSKSQRYRTVLRDEAWARYLEETGE